MNREEQIAVLEAWGNEPPTPITIKGHTFHVRELSTAEMDRRLIANRNPEEWQKDLTITRGATAVLCDEHGNLTMDPQNQDDVRRVGKVAWSRMNKIASVIQAKEADIEEGN